MLAHMNDITLHIPEGCYGKELKDLMFKFTNCFPEFHELRDKVELNREKQEIIVSMVLARALELMDKDSQYNDIIPTVKKRIAQDLEVSLKDGTLTSVRKEKQKLLTMKYELNRARSRVKELESFIEICRSGLSYDKKEIEVLQP